MASWMETRTSELEVSGSNLLWRRAHIGVRQECEEAMSLPREPSG